MNQIEKGMLRAFVLLQRENLITNVEKAARSLGIHGIASANSNDRLWEIAHEADPEPEPKPPVIVGAEPVVEIKTVEPEGGQKPGVRPPVSWIGTAGR